MRAPYYADDSVTLYAGDCLDVLRELPSASVDAVVTDPPYGLEFMGRTWDAPWQESDVNADAGFHGGGIDATRKLPSFTGSTNPKCLTCKGTRRGRRDGTAKVAVCLCIDGGRFPNHRAVEMRAFGDWCESWATECLRVLKPGGHLLAFGGTRTWHRLACAVEDAGFEMRDSIAWLYGSGFPKSLRVDRDERFCQCAANADTSSHTSPEPRPAGHTRTEDAEDATAGGVQSAHHARREALDSPVDCRDGHGSGDALPHPAPVAGLAAAPSPADAPGHIRSVEPGGARGDAASRTLSPAPRSGHPSSPGYLRPSDDPSSLYGDTGSSSRPPLRTDSDSESRTADTQRKGASPSAYPHCLTCGKPQAKGLGTALKPAFEPVVVARRPLAGTVAANVLAHGTGALNVDGCRTATTDNLNGGTYSAGGNTADLPGAERSAAAAGMFAEGGGRLPGGFVQPARRWPANVVLDESQAAELDRQSGVSVSPSGTGRHPSSLRTSMAGGVLGAQEDGAKGHGDTGGASRFFYVAKAPTLERPRDGQVAHPTVKPLDLMRWLVRLVTPPGGTVLDPFAGSGTTAEACVIEGFRCITIEREADYLPLIVARLSKPIQPDMFGGVA